MKNKTFKPSYEAPQMDVQTLEAEGILCISSGRGVNESYEELDKEYNFTWN